MATVRQTEFATKESRKSARIRIQNSRWIHVASFAPHGPCIVCPCLSKQSEASKGSGPLQELDFACEILGGTDFAVFAKLGVPKRLSMGWNFAHVKRKRQGLPADSQTTKMRSGAESELRPVFPFSQIGYNLGSRWGS